MTSSSHSLSQKLTNAFSKIQKIDPKQLGFKCAMTSDITVWNIEYFSFVKGSKIERDMIKYKEETGKDYLEFELRFSEQYPSIPPSLRIIQPALSTEYSGSGAFCFNGLFTSVWQQNTEVDTGLVNAFNYIFNDNDPNINFGRKTPHTLEEAQNGWKVIHSSHKSEWGESSV
jgi:ubiquitin-protein ligase